MKRWVQHQDFGAWALAFAFMAWMAWGEWETARFYKWAREETDRFADRLLRSVPPGKPKPEQSPYDDVFAGKTVDAWLR